METRDLGTHVVELHELGRLDITGPGTRLTLPAHEALELMQWLYTHREILYKANNRTTQQLGIQGDLNENEGAPNEVDLPVDEP